jgi:hypothetical protein
MSGLVGSRWCGFGSFASDRRPAEGSVLDQPVEHRVADLVVVQTSRIDSRRRAAKRLTTIVRRTILPVSDFQDDDLVRHPTLRAARNAPPRVRARTRRSPRWRCSTIPRSSKPREPSPLASCKRGRHGPITHHLRLPPRHLVTARRHRTIRAAQLARGGPKRFFDGGTRRQDAAGYRPRFDFLARLARIMRLRCGHENHLAVARSEEPAQRTR